MPPNAPVQAYDLSAVDEITLNKLSDGAGAGSSQSSGTWLTREARLSGPAACTKVEEGPLAKEVPLPSHIPGLAPPIELVESIQVGRASRRSQRVQRWLAEQQHLTTDMDAATSDSATTASGAVCNPHSDYPSMSSRTIRKEDGDEAGLLRSFVIVEEDGLPVRGVEGLPGLGSTYGFEVRSLPTVDEVAEQTSQNDQVCVDYPHNDFSPPVVPYAHSTHTSSLRAPRPMSVLSITSWRNLPFAKTLPQRYFPTSEEPVDLSTPPQTPKKNVRVRRRSPIPETFRDTDVPAISKNSRTAQNKTSTGTLRASEIPRSMRQRLSNLVRVHGHAGSSSESPGSTKAPDSPRPSTSTSSVTATTSTAVENELLSEMRANAGRHLPKFTLNLSKAARLAPIDLSSPTRSTFSSSTQTISTPSAPSRCGDAPYTVPPLPPLPFPPTEPAQSPALSKKRSQINVFRDRGYNASSSALSTLSITSIGSIATSIGGRSSNVFSGSSSAKRKKLVVSGIERDDTAAVEGLRRWCERFGELRQITRMPNGDLLIDFKRADVADTVCRISARVHIPDVGSVNMTWISGKKR
ncbi:hypothetical protein M0805_007163 [Coniferiporia weirii]|nr:hypothetical protein M0805_007163 [Coniferiporia weirii]